MKSVQTIFNLALQIYSIQIDLFGYSVSLLNVSVYSIVGYILLVIMYKVFH